MENRLFRVVAPHFVAGFSMSSGKIKEVAPIIHYFSRWNLDEVAEYCKKRGWSIEEINSGYQYRLTLTSTTELNRKLLKWIGKDPLLNGGIFYQIRRGGDLPEPIRFVINSSRLEKRNSQLVIDASFGNQNKRVIIEKPVWEIDDGVKYPARVFVFGGPNVEVVTGDDNAEREEW